MEDHAPPPGSAAVSFRCDPPDEAVLGAGLKAFLPQIIMARARIDLMEQIAGGHRVEFGTAPGTHLEQLARDCTTAVEDAFHRQDIHAGWSLVVVDDQGRIYRPR